MTISRPDTPVRKRPRDRRDRILAAAAERFASSGARAAAMEEIAADVGITAGAIYRHFRGKDELLAEVLRQAVDRLVGASSGAGGSLPELVAAMVEVVATDPARVVVLVREHGGRDTTAAGRAELTDSWSAALKRAGSQLDQQRVGHRLWAMLAALCEMASSGGGTALQGQVRLVTDAFVAYWTSPPVRTADPRPPRRTWQPVVSRADQILATAVALFRERGYHDVGMDDIAAAVGMVASGLYRFYPSKADLLLDAYDLVVARVMTEMDQVCSTATGPREALRGIVDLQVRAALASVDLIFVTDHERHALPAGERPRLARRRRKIMETLTGLLLEVRPELDTKQARLLLFGLQPLIREGAASPFHPPNPAREVSALAMALLLGHENEH